MENNEKSIEILPNELLLIIGKYLSDLDLSRLMKTSRRFYILLRPEFEKTMMFGNYLHNFFLGFYITNNESSDALYSSEYGQRYMIKKYCDFEKLQDSMFVISRIGDIWSWNNLPIGTERGKYKQITCKCDSKYCPKEQHIIVDINLRSSVLNIAIKQNMWPIFIKEQPGFKKAFELIKDELESKDNQILEAKLKQ